MKTLFRLKRDKNGFYESIYFGKQCVLQLHGGTVINNWFAKTIVDHLNILYCSEIYEIIDKYNDAARREKKLNR